MPAAPRPTPRSRRRVPRRGRIFPAAVRRSICHARRSGPSRRSAPAAPLCSAATSWPATTAITSGSLTTPAAIGIAPSARRWREPSGSSGAQAELLPIPYFHLVFTLPQEIAALALQNKRLMYGMLFEAARADDRRGGRQSPSPRRRRRRHSGRAPHVGPEPHAPSSSALCRERRRAVTGRPALDRLEVLLLLAGARPQPRVPPQVLRAAASGL